VAKSIELLSLQQYNEVSTRIFQNWLSRFRNNHSVDIRGVMMKRIFFNSYRSLVNSEARHNRFDIYFTGGEGDKYVWTPELKGGVKQLFLEIDHLIARPHGLVKKPAQVAVVQVAQKIEPEGEIIDFGTLAYKIGEMLKNKATERQIEIISSALFNFKAEEHVNANIVNIVSQSIYNWVMTLGEQPISQERKSRLLKQFVGALAPLGSPLKKLAETP
jgi:hypothetical protein